MVNEFLFAFMFPLLLPSSSVKLSFRYDPVNLLISTDKLPLVHKRCIPIRTCVQYGQNAVLQVFWQICISSVFTDVLLCGQSYPMKNIL